MRLITVFLISTLISISASGAEKPTVVSSASMISDIAQNIGGDKFTYETIVPIGGDPHIYEPTPSDAQLCSRANLILKNGLTFEGWIVKLINNSGTSATIVTVTEGVDAIQSEHYQNATDPHAWMAAHNGIIYARNIARAMSALNPVDSAFFGANLKSYVLRLETLDAYIIDKIQSIPEQKRILITSHDAFHYYGKRYGLRLESILGTSTDADVQTADIRRLNEVIRTSQVPAVFVESTINPRMLSQIASDNNIAVGGKLYADSLGDKDSPASTYIDMLRHNTDTIYEALMQSRTTDQSGEKAAKSWMWILLFAPVFIGITYLVIRLTKRA
jgi:ABC-type Zn uptake system ZnuABC Zn-binding protein ZnuA